MDNKKKTFASPFKFGFRSKKESSRIGSDRKAAYYDDEVQIGYYRYDTEARKGEGDVGFYPVENDGYYSYVDAKSAQANRPELDFESLIGDKYADEFQGSQIV